MTRAIVVMLGLALSLGTVLAQPAPPPNPGAGSGSSAKPGTDEKAGAKEHRQSIALGLFQEGNMRLNDGIFKEAVAKYREALKSWEHPAIQYNMALALMNLDFPIEVEESLTKSIRFGAAPLEEGKFEHAKEY